MFDSKNLFSLEGETIVVTGGAGHLGQAICFGLAQAGAKVLALGRNKEKLEMLALRNEVFPEKRIFGFQVDVTDEKSFRTFVGESESRFGPITCLINNANAAARDSWDQLTLEKWNEGLKGSLHHYFTCSKIVSESFLKTGKGTVINNASLFAFLAPNFPMHLDLNNAAAAHHVAAKGGILQLTRYLATLWGPSGIRVNAVSPGYFPQKRGPERPDYMKEIQLRVPMKRIGQAEEVAGAFIFLASKAASYVTGQNIVVDGGYSVW